MTSTPRPWYEELFESGDYVRFWVEGGMTSDERTLREVDFLVSALQLPEGAHILDLCCGHGRHSIALAQRGYRVTGLDLSRLHLDMAAKSALEAGVEVDWVQADMRDIPGSLAGRMDAVINMFSAFGYLESDAEDQKVLDTVARMLKPEGRFFIDLMHHQGLFRRFRLRDWEKVGGALVLHESAFDYLAGRSTETMRIIEADGTRRTTSFTVRIYTLPELAAMLEHAGLAVRQAWGDFDGSELGLDSRRLLVMAEKPRRTN